MVKTYRKKPVVIEAIEWNGNNFNDILEFAKQSIIKIDDKDIDHSFYIITLEGNMKVGVGDYIIKGVKGEFYSCKPDIFKMTYEEVEF